MAWVDWAIVLVMVLSVLGGLTQGFFRSFCSLGGLCGPGLAAWNYGRVAAMFCPGAHRAGGQYDRISADCAAGDGAGRRGRQDSLQGLHQMGLGCLDRLAGAVFGFFQGALLVTLVILVAVAFFPRPTG